jgi:hypothetical protein
MPGAFVTAVLFKNSMLPPTHRTGRARRAPVTGMMDSTAKLIAVWELCRFLDAYFLL